MPQPLQDFFNQKKVSSIVNIFVFLFTNLHTLFAAENNVLYWLHYTPPILNLIPWSLISLWSWAVWRWREGKLAPKAHHTLNSAHCETSFLKHCSTSTSYFAETFSKTCLYSCSGNDEENNYCELSLGHIIYVMTQKLII